MLNLSHKDLDVYKTTRTFPKEELYILVSQIRRAVISVLSNITEGASRISKKEKKRFYEIARGSLVEIDSQFQIAITLNYYQKGQRAELEQYLESVFRTLSKMIENLRKNPLPTSQTPLPSTQTPLAK